MLATPAATYYIIYLDNIPIWGWDKPSGFHWQEMGFCNNTTRDPAYRCHEHEPAWTRHLLSRGSVLLSLSEVGVCFCYDLSGTKMHRQPQHPPVPGGGRRAVRGFQAGTELLPAAADANYLLIRDLDLDLHGSVLPWLLPRHRRAVTFYRKIPASFLWMP